MYAVSYYIGPHYDIWLHLWTTFNFAVLLTILMHVPPIDQKQQNITYALYLCGEDTLQMDFLFRGTVM